MTKKEIKALIKQNKKLEEEANRLREENSTLKYRVEVAENANLWLAEQLEHRNRAISHHGYLREIDVL